MGSISIRNVDDQLAQKLKQQARSSQKSVNQLVLDILNVIWGWKKKNATPGRMMIWTCSSGAGRRTILSESRGK